MICDFKLKSLYFIYINLPYLNFFGAFESNYIYQYYIEFLLHSYTLNFMKPCKCIKQKKSHFFMFVYSQRFYMNPRKCSSAMLNGVK